MSALEIALAVISAVAGAATKSIASTWSERKSLKAKLGKVDDVADSARFQAIEQAVGALTIQFDNAKKASDDKIRELEGRLASATTALAEAHGDLTRSTAVSVKYQRVVEFFYGELQSLRRDAGLPKLPPLETYIEQHGARHEPRSTPDADRHRDHATPRPAALSAVRGQARRPPPR